MNISPVNNSQSFKGLWGKIDIFSRSSDDNFVHIATKNYHPFKDETKEEIAEVERFNSSKYEAAWFETGGINIKEERSVQTMAPLNFTKKEYEAYKQSKIGAKTPAELSHPVERDLVANGLEQYLNNSKEYINETLKQKRFTYKVKEFFNNIGQKLKRL